jgi:hypothetical protein
MMRIELWMMVVYCLAWLSSCSLLLETFLHALGFAVSVSLGHMPLDFGMTTNIQLSMRMNCGGLMVIFCVLGVVYLLQKNVDEAVAKLKAEGLDVFGLACHVSFADQRANLIKSTIDVRIWKLPILLLALLLHLVLTLAQENIQSWKDVINSSRAYYTHHISLDT